MFPECKSCPGLQSGTGGGRRSCRGALCEAGCGLSDAAGGGVGWASTGLGVLVDSLVD